MRDGIQIGVEKARPERDQRVIVDRPYARTARWTWVHLVGDRDERQRSFRCGLRGLRSGLPEFRTARGPPSVAPKTPPPRLAIGV